jgi:hypothetical protein
VAGSARPLKGLVAWQASSGRAHRGTRSRPLPARLRPPCLWGAGLGSRLRSSVCRFQPVVPLCFAQAPGRLRQSTSQFGQVSRLRGRSHNYAFKRTAGRCFDVH